MIIIVHNLQLSGSLLMSFRLDFITRITGDQF